jgi:hypothetical protein
MLPTVNVRVQNVLESKEKNCTNKLIFRPHEYDQRD